MNKQELVAAIAAKAGISQADAGKVVNATFDVITETLKAGEKIVITGFGQFEAKERAARTGINPATGAQIKIAACKVPGFKAGKALKDAVNA